MNLIENVEYVEMGVCLYFLGVVIRLFNGDVMVKNRFLFFFFLFCEVFRGDYGEVKEKFC